MCGHVGILGPGITSSDIKVLDDLARVCVVRGKDGAGILQGKTDYQRLNYRHAKTGYEIGDLIWQQKQKEGDKWLFNDPSDNFFCVHVRAATVGSITQKNAHPFEFANIVAMHNGTLKATDYYAKDDRTDSELMIKDMSNKGIEKVLQNLDADSAYALVALDKKTHQIVFARNKHRPLCFAVNAQRGVMYYASESGMLSWVLSRNDIKYEKILIFNEDMTYRVDPRTGIKANKFPDFERTDLLVKLKDTTVPLLEAPKSRGTPLLLSQSKKTNQTSTQKAGKIITFPTEKTRQGQFSALVDNRGTGVVRPRSSFHTTCVSCTRDLNLFDKSRATKVKSDGVVHYVCDTCNWDEDMTSFFQANLHGILQ